jgi:hypothetical protein
VINTFTTILHEGTYQQTTAMFFASLMLVIGGAVTVLVFAPRGKVEEKPAKPKPAEEKKAKPAAEARPAQSPAQPAATSTSEPAVPDKPDVAQSDADKTNSEPSK